jgi:hypothetical protein
MVPIMTINLQLGSQTLLSPLQFACAHTSSLTRAVDLHQESKSDADLVEFVFAFFAFLVSFNGESRDIAIATIDEVFDGEGEEIRKRPIHEFFAKVEF